MCVFFCAILMDNTITDEDIQFMRWLDSKECEHYWIKNDQGEKVILREGWDEALKEYNKMKPLFDNKNAFRSNENTF